jgi:hypothetical protein
MRQMVVGSSHPFIFWPCYNDGTVPGVLLPVFCLSVQHGKNPEGERVEKRPGSLSEVTQSSPRAQGTVIESNVSTLFAES